jgi:Ammonium Transporter Family
MVWFQSWFDFECQHCGERCGLRFGSCKHHFGGVRRCVVGLVYEYNLGVSINELNVLQLFLFFTHFILRTSYYVAGYHTYDLTMTMNGALTGLVAITGGCASVDTWSAVLIGMVAGWVYMFSSKLIIRLHIDDAVDAIPVHMFGGAWGVIATGLFSKPDLMLRAYGKDTHVGWFFEWGMGSGDFTLIGIQLISLLWIFSWTFVTMGSYFYLLHFMGWLRVDPLEEEVGLDVSRHKGSAYDIQAANDDSVKQLANSRSGAKHVIAPVKAEEEPPKETPYEGGEVEA